MLTAVIRDGAVAELVPEGGDVPASGWDLIVKVEDNEVAIGDRWPIETPSVPEFVTARQARLALLGAGLLQTVEQVLANMTGVQGEAARIEWEYATEVQRHSPLIEALAPAMGLTDEQIDNLFRAAEGI